VRGTIDGHRLYDNGEEETGLRVSELAERLGAAWEGEDREVSDVAPLESARDEQLSFVGNRKAAAAAAQSEAGCLLVTGEFPPGRTLIRVKDPRAAFAAAIRILRPTTHPEPGVHRSTVIAASASVSAEATIGPHVTIAEGVSVGPRTIIGAGCAIGAGSSIGADCILHSHVTIYEQVKVGDRVILHAGCVLGADGFGFVLQNGRYEKFPQIGTVEVGDDVEIGANACIDRAALGVTRIGNGTKLDNMVHVGHNCRIGNHVVVAAQTGFSGGVVVEDYAVIGGQVGVGDKARIESRAVLGSGCGILTSKIVRRDQVVWGTPARPLKLYLEQLASLARLPDMRAELTEIKKMLSELRGRLESRPAG
jgi:UDP-3-O-[3-hydroxymyristoyl] glucosamine N-acyltransferase